MVRLTIGAKIGAGFLLSGALLIACGWAGIRVANNLSLTLSEIGGAVRDTENAAAAVMTGVRDELLGVDAILDGREEIGTSTLEGAKAALAEASRHIREGGIVSHERIAAAESSQNQFSAILNRLLETHGQHTNNESNLNRNNTRLRDFMIDVERLASQAELEKGLNEQAQDDSGASDSWAVINAASEARLALLKRLNLYHHIQRTGDSQSLQSEAAQALEDLHYIAEDLGASPIFSTRVRNGPMANQSYAQALNLQIEEHGRFFDAAVGSRQQLKTLHEEYQAAADRVLASYDRLVESIRQNVASRVAESDETASNAVRGVLMAVAFGLLAGIAGWLFSLHAIATPLRHASEQLHQIAAGDGDLNTRLDVRGNDEIADLAGSFNGFTLRLREIVERLRQSVTHLSEAAQNVDAVANQTERKAEQQTGEVGSVAAAVNELAASFAEVSTNTREAAEQASHSDQRTNEALAVMDTTIRAIQSGAGEVVRAAGVLNDLESRSERIGGVLDVIRTISEQTNLLALNAAIEAARAGESGRGFAVVADEVRALARRTNDSIGEIQEMIDQLQKGSRQALEVMESARNLTEGSVAPAHEAGAALNQIGASVRSITDLNHHIARACEEQLSTIAEIERSMASISELAADTADQAGGLNGSTNSLTSVCEELKGIVGMFRA
ncbi:MAG: methyl-accepting chemotaxis protein [Chromatiales bacterium]|nr:methyl-accepting chemotaxis protein [Chromatiales bacterium]